MWKEEWTSVPEDHPAPKNDFGWVRGVVAIMAIIVTSAILGTMLVNMEDTPRKPNPTEVRLKAIEGKLDLLDKRATANLNALKMYIKAHKITRHPKEIQ